MVIIQIVIALLLIALVLLQAGGGLGGLWGGGGESYRSKRGAEKILFVATALLAACFLLASITNILLY